MFGWLSLNSVARHIAIVIIRHTNVGFRVTIVICIIYRYNSLELKNQISYFSFVSAFNSDMCWAYGITPVFPRNAFKHWHSNRLRGSVFMLNKRRGVRVWARAVKVVCTYASHTYQHLYTHACQHTCICIYLCIYVGTCVAFVFVLFIPSPAADTLEAPTEHLNRVCIFSHL